VDQKSHLPAGAADDPPYAVSVTPERAGWTYSGLRVLELPAGGSHSWATRDEEMLVLPLQGSWVVGCDGQRLELQGRDNVFSRVTDFAYLPIDTEVTVSTPGGGRVALPSARATRRLPVRYGAAEDVPVEVRGAGSASRQVNNFCAPSAFDCDKLVAVEVLTPGGNWSSYPPHKHDDHTEDQAVLEEIYYFEVASDQATPGFGYQRVYGRPDRPINVLAEVRSGDVVLVPHGYHGPSMAAPGYDLYYLNVLAGPADERSMAFCDDPAHAWVRGSWTGQSIDARLPLTSSRSAS
jgi:5-deoxy-glucuronate isomerase